jgi:hypothetical protein
VLGWSMLAIAAIAAVGWLVVEREGVTFGFQRSTPSFAPTRSDPRVPLAAIALGSDRREKGDECIEARDYACVREELLPRLSTLSRDRARSLRIACAALADYGCVLRVDSLRDR